MEPPIIHIGFHKTATNFFQKTFYQYLRGAEMIRRLDVKKYLLEPRAFEFDSNVAREKLVAHAGRRIIICEEDLSGHIHSGGLHGFATQIFAERIKQTFPQAKIVIFIRNQFDMIASIYRTYIKGGGTHSVQKYLFHQQGNPQYNFPLFSFGHLDYLLTIQMYQKLFGADHVHIFCYEAFEADNRGFLEDYAEKLHLDVDWDNIECVKVNVGFDNYLLQLKRFLNMFSGQGNIFKYYIVHIPHFYRALHLFMYHLARIDHGVKKLFRSDIQTSAVRNDQLLGKDIMDYINQYYRKGNTELKNACHLPLERYRYPLIGKD